MNFKQSNLQVTKGNYLFWILQENEHKNVLAEF